MAAGDNAYWVDIADLINKPICKLVKLDAQSVASGTLTALTFGAGSEEIKTHASMHSTASNTSRVVVPVSGYYDLKANVTWQFTQAISSGDIIFYLNGSPVSYSGNFKYTTPHTSNTAVGGWFYSDVLQAAAGDYFELRARHTSTAAVAQSTQTGEARTRFSVKFERPL